MFRKSSALILTAFLMIPSAAGAAQTLPASASQQSSPFASRTFYGAPSAVNNACAWHIIHSPNKSTTFANFQNQLVGVEGTSATDAWADGYYANSTGAHSLLEHWNGSAWSLVTAPAPSGGTSDVLNGIGANSSTDVWAVGTYFNISANESQTLTMHYNGVNWTIVSSPNPANSNSFVRRVSVVNGHDAWAVGQSTDVSSGNTSPLMLHWNGQNWSIVTGYNVGEPFSNLVDVKAFSGSSVSTMGDWATDQAGSILRPQGAHYNGAWTVQTTPFMGTASSPLNAQAAISASNIWGIGDWYDGTNFQTLAENWNGSTWTIVPSPDEGGPEGSGLTTVLFAAAAVNASDVWGAGVFYDGSRTQTYTMQWTGASWATVATPDSGGPDAFYNQLNGVSKISGTTDAWAVGFHGTSGNNTIPSKTLVLEFHC
jgi:hypothetical protein